LAFLQLDIDKIAQKPSLPIENDQNKAEEKNSNKMSLIEKLPNEVLLDIFDLLTIKVRLLRGNVI
jgi:hypothetical protein